MIVEMNEVFNAIQVQDISFNNFDGIQPKKV